MTIDEAIKRFKDNAEYERSNGSLQGCLEFRQLVEWLAELKKLKKQMEPYENCTSKQTIKEQMIKYGFHAPDMTVTEFVEDLPSVTPLPKIGHGIRVDKDKCKCDKCEVISFIAMYPNGDINYCPNCGLKMEEGE